MWFERLLAVAILAFALPAQAQSPRYGFGRTPTAAEIAAWNDDVRADGEGLPPGQGSVAEGHVVFERSCVACHGDKGQGGPADRLVGGTGTLTQRNPVKTVGSYWPYTTTLFDYIRRAMPFSAPGTLSDNDVYAVSAYVLFLNGIVSEDAVLNASTAPRILMPNRNGFSHSDPRPDVR